MNWVLVVRSLWRTADKIDREAGGRQTARGELLRALGDALNEGWAGSRAGGD